MQYQITKVALIGKTPLERSSNEKAKQELSIALNHNSVLFNSPYPSVSNLMDYSDRSVFRKSTAEKEALKKAKKEYKKSLIA